jgi:uncharacterized membrane protein (UPF0127 family)
MMNGMNRHARPWFRRTVIGAGMAIPLITAIVWMRSEDRMPPRARIETPGGPIVVEIAATSASRSAGLSNRRELRGIDGMLLKWDAPGRHPIWMAGMRFPLDVAWIDANSRVLAILTNVPRCRADPCSVYEPDGTQDSVAVLELRAGTAVVDGIAVGTILRPSRVEQTP